MQFCLEHNLTPFQWLMLQTKSELFKNSQDSDVFVEAFREMMKCETGDIIECVERMLVQMKGRMEMLR